MTKTNKIAIVGLSSLLGISIFGVAFSDNSLDIISAEDSPYSLTLNSSNAYSGSTNETVKSISTDSNGYKVDFTYKNATAYSSGHVKLNDGGSLTNKDHILSIGSITVNFTGSLKFRCSYDSNTWANYSTLSSGVKYNLASNPYYVEFVSSGVTSIDSIKYTYSCEVNPDAESSGTGEYKLVSSASDLIVGDNYVIAAKDANVAMSTTQNNNNRGQATITKNTKNNTISWSTSSNVCEFELASGSKSNTYAFYDGVNDGYIYAASSKENYLRTGYLNDNSSYSISISSTSTSLTAQGSNTRNRIRYNSSSSIFSCYSSGQAEIVLYHKDGGGVIAPTDEVGFTATDSNASNYQVGDIYNSKNSLVVKASYSDGSTKTLSSSDYTYVIKNSSNQVVSSTTAFANAGTYKVIVSYKNYYLK